jgi:hypothetical protein
VSWWAASIPGGLIAIGWVLTGRILVAQSKALTEVRERVARLEGRLNGTNGGSDK